MQHKYSIKHDMALWYMVISMLVFFSLALIFFNDEDYGFNSESYGLGVLVTILFPLIWIIIYCLCNVISKRNKEIEELKKEK